ncbi:hypothetical protein BpHYR1_031234 [Brachionus plicatilis]|uniref:Uncharacterized protein n=1 Tax=Brachionus plicatilis TaxID=10195 RepID=A0A3M7QEG1_BRAPC|nr:hypothetical protein BpHYR1_031234 [Brachionus plicatilis]
MQHTKKQFSIRQKDTLIALTLETVPIFKTKEYSYTRIGLPSWSNLAYDYRFRRKNLCLIKLSKDDNLGLFACPNYWYYYLSINNQSFFLPK